MQYAREVRERLQQRSSPDGDIFADEGCSATPHNAFVEDLSLDERQILRANQVVALAANISKASTSITCKSCAPQARTCIRHQAGETWKPLFGQQQVPAMAGENCQIANPPTSTTNPVRTIRLELGQTSWHRHGATNVPTGRTTRRGHPAHCLVHIIHKTHKKWQRTIVHNFAQVAAATTHSGWLDQRRPGVALVPVGVRGAGKQNNVWERQYGDA